MHIHIKCFQIKENNLELSELQKEKIKELCNKYLELADFENAIRYTKYNNSNRTGLQIAYVFIYGTINKNLILNILRMYY